MRTIARIVNGVLAAAVLAGIAVTTSPASASPRSWHQTVAKIERKEARMHTRRAKRLAAHGRYRAAARQRMEARRFRQAARRQRQMIKHRL